jgi:hypothetical protein
MQEGRKWKVVRVPDGYGRDGGKHFMIDEWSSSRADKWANRAILSLNRGSGDVNIDALIGGGMEAIFFVGVKTFLRGQVKAEELQPLLDELLDCVRFVRVPTDIDQMTGRQVATPIVCDDDIAEIKTLWWLRSEVLELHVGFSPADVVGRLLSSILTPPKSPETSGST